MEAFTMIVTNILKDVNYIFLDTAPVVYYVEQNPYFFSIVKPFFDRTKLRAQYNITLPDALQIAVAIESKCDVFLTNDANLKRVKELKILVLKDLLC